MEIDMKTKKLNPTLMALTSSALTLLTSQPVIADAPPDQAVVGVRYGKYIEDDIGADKTLNARSSERYDIDVAQFHLLTPVGDNWSLEVDAQWENMSGASPWYTSYNNAGDAKVIMSGASIKDTRKEVGVTTRYFFDRGNVGINYTNSSENDYKSNAFSLDGSFNSADGMQTYSAAISMSNDDIIPTIGRVQTNTVKAEKDIRSAWFGVSQIINQNSLVRFGLGYTYREGFLTDPYKARDKRPDKRTEWAFSTGYRHFFDKQDAALHLDYRYFQDDWDVVSHTIDAAWVQNIGDSLQLKPFVRYYTQDEAKFFSSVVNNTNQNYYSDDYRLSAYGAFSGGLKATYDIGNWTLVASGERYQSDGRFGMFDYTKAPGSVNFWRYNLGFDYRF